MADDISEKAKTSAKRSRAYRQRKKAAAVPEGPASDATPADHRFCWRYGRLRP
jgi:hypothetical protein